MRRVPIYHVRTWRKRGNDRHRVTFRPGLMTLSRRLLWTVGIVALAIPVELAYSRYKERIENSPTSKITEAQKAEIEALESSGARAARELLTEEEYNAVMEEAAANREAYRARVDKQRTQSRALVTYGRNAALVFLGVLALLAPLSCLWNRMTLERDAYGNLVVRYWRILPGKRTWPLDTFSHINIYAYEKIGHSRYWGFESHGWHWIAQLALKGSRQGPVLMDLAFSSEPLGPQFFVHRQRKRPRGDAPLPRQVHVFAEALNFLTALTYDKPSIIETKSMSTVGRKPVIRRSMSVVDPGTRVTQTFGSLDEIPPELQGRFQELIAQAKDSPSGGMFSSTTQRITVKNADGTTQTYNSLEEMPPEMRKIFEKRFNR